MVSIQGLFLLVVLGLATACSGDEELRPTPEPGEPTSAATAGSGPATAVPGTISVSAPQGFSLSPLPKSPQAPSPRRDDPAVVTAQTLVYDTTGGTLTVAGDASISNMSAWLDERRLLVRIENVVAIYDATAQTGQKLDGVPPLGDGIGQVSPDGRWLALRQSDTSLTLIDLQRLSFRTVAIDAFPNAWSPDSSRLLVNHPLGYSLLSLMQLGSPLALPTGPGHPQATAYRWTSGTRLISTMRVAAEEGTRLTLVDVSDGSVRVVSEGIIEGGFDSVSPDGKLLAVSVGGVLTSTSVVIYRLEPLERIGVIEGLSFSGQRFAARETWTSDSRRILAQRNICTANETLALVDVATGAETLVAKVGAIAFVLSPAGNQVAYTAGTELYLAPVDGASVGRHIFSPTHAPVAPRWSDDGRYIAFARYFGGYGRCP